MLRYLIPIFTLMFMTAANAACPAIDPVGEPVGITGALEPVLVPVANGKQQVITPTNGSYYHVCHTLYSVILDAKTKNPAWDAGVVTKESATGPAVRGPFFKQDPLLPIGIGSTDKDYQGAVDKLANLIARGHNFNAEDSALNDIVMHESFYFPNMFPQVQVCNNSGVWRSAEILIHNWAIKYGKVYVVNGPIYKLDVGTIGNGVKIPTHLYKVAYIPQLNKTISFIMPNTQLCKRKPDEFVTTQADVETQTGFKFFPNVSGYTQVKSTGEIK